jgi:predicted transcriptional regulator
VNIDEDNYLAHIGTPRHSGRYPWGSGANPQQRNKNLLDHIEQMKAKGLSDKEIYEGLGMTSTEYRNRRTIAKAEAKQAKINLAVRLKDEGMSNMAIGKQMGINESSVRSLLKASEDDKVHIITTVSNMLRDEVERKGMVDVGTGVENYIGISKEKLGTAIALLKDEGYKTIKLQENQLGTAPGNKTTILVLVKPGVEYKDIVTRVKDVQQIDQIQAFSTDGGRSMSGILPPLNVSSSRIDIKYAKDGGAEADGVMYVRPGVPDVSIGANRYAQVRVAVDGTHYLKGMAMYKGDLPKGVDIQFNTNKDDTGNKIDAMKPMKDDPGNPFGSQIRRQIVKEHPDGSKEVTSSMNLVNEAGSWEAWRKALSSQVLSKQSPALAKTQLDLTYESKKADLDEIMSLTNPVIRKKLLDGFSESADSAAVHLHAAALPRQQSHVILPVQSMKSTEIYAPNYNNGERVALIRYPHAGIFEIPELTVNNNQPEAKALLGRATDAVGINHKVAEHLSGADFDGDTVLVIPNPAGNPHLKTMAPLHDLKNFDPKKDYPAYEGMVPMTEREKGQQMGLVSNLITDMTIQRASTADLARAVKHSMVVIDAEKHNLDWRGSSRANNIPQLMKKYQGRSGGGASTLISKATSRQMVDRRKKNPASEGGHIDPATGKKLWIRNGESYVHPKTGKVVFPQQRSTKLAETDDAHTLSSGTAIEKVYADHSNRLKALANEARKEYVRTPSLKYSPSAKAAYAEEVKALDGALNLAVKNRPLERQAQVIANAHMALIKEANPTMDDAELRKKAGQVLMEARSRTGADKQQIKFTDREWQAIQAGAITNHKLEQLLNNADLDRVKELATPRAVLMMTATKQRRAQEMLDRGFTQAEVASQLGVSVTTLKKSLTEGGG